jgi:ribA/ribD-fused uncharacterized protein
MKINKFENEYAFLSNFFPSRIFTPEQDIAESVEHYFQAEKTNNYLEYIGVLHANTPGQAKRLGRKLTLRPDWEEVKDKVMYNALKQKFAIPELKKLLLATGDAELEEGTWWHDNYWGNCYCEKCKNIQGKNMLGKLLMKIREEIKNEEAL